MDVQTGGLTYTARAAITLDGAPIEFPLAFMGEIAADHAQSKTLIDDFDIEDSETETTYAVVGAVYYTGRRDLQLGMALQSAINQEPEVGTDENGNEKKSRKPIDLFGSFPLRYIW